MWMLLHFLTVLGFQIFKIWITFSININQFGSQDPFFFLFFPPIQSYTEYFYNHPHTTQADPTPSTPPFRSPSSK